LRGLLLLLIFSLCESHVAVTATQVRVPYISTFSCFGAALGCDAVQAISSSALIDSTRVCVVKLLYLAAAAYNIGHVGATLLCVARGSCRSCWLLLAAAVAAAVHLHMRVLLCI
jgi:hypothetical protein